jgi:hypothetical protein
MVQKRNAEARGGISILVKKGCEVKVQQTSKVSVALVVSLTLKEDKMIILRIHGNPSNSVRISEA